MTLIEICMVTVLLAIILAAGWPALNHATARLQLELAGQNLIQTFRYSRDRAMSDGRHYLIQITPDSKQFALKMEKDPLNDPGIFIEADTRHALQRFWNNAKDISITEISRSEILFNPDGTADGCILTLRDRRGNALKLAIDALSGKAVETLRQG